MAPFFAMLNVPSVIPSKVVLPSGCRGKVSCVHPQPWLQIAAPDTGIDSNESTIALSGLSPEPLNAPPPVPLPLPMNPTLQTPFTGMQSAMVNVGGAEEVAPAVRAYPCPETFPVTENVHC